jgi:branched-chain amino acid transport system substrate-binding protein
MVLANAFYCVPPGVKINTTPTSYTPVPQLQLMRIKGEAWELFGSVIGTNGN